MARLSDRISGSPQDLSQYATKVEVAAEYATKTELNNPNLLINGGFDIWQRGTTFSGGVSRYMVDHWACSPPRTALNRVADVGEGFYVTSDCEYLTTPIELSTIGVLSPFVNNNTYTVTLRLRGEGVLNVSGLFRDSIFGGVNDVSAFDAPAEITLTTTTWTDYTITFPMSVLPASTNICFVLSIQNTNTTTGYIQASNAKLEEGPTATPYKPRPIGEELALCQRYYQKGDAGVAGQGEANAVQLSGNATTGGEYVAQKSFSQIMRITPVVTSASIFSSSFPTSGLTNASNKGFVERRNANGTGVGRFFSSWTADAEL